MKERINFIYNHPILKERRKGLRKNQTDAERKIWYYMRNKQIGGLKFFRQYSVGPYILDFYCPRLHLAIELDGSQHLEQERREYDKERSYYLSQRKIIVTRFWNNDVLQNTEAVVAKIQRACSLRGKLYEK